MPRCLIIAGPNGAGKTTFARTFLPEEKIQHFINADLLAAGLSPLNPAAARVTAGRLFLGNSIAWLQPKQTSPLRVP